jgi:hypothetical protein
MWQEDFLQRKIRTECTQLTNSTASATFELVWKDSREPGDENGHMVNSHINVIIADPHQSID